jgi:hypothetical protein
MHPLHNECSLFYKYPTTQPDCNHCIFISPLTYIYFAPLLLPLIYMSCLAFFYFSIVPTQIIHKIPKTMNLLQMRPHNMSPLPPFSFWFRATVTLLSAVLFFFLNKIIGFTNSTGKGQTLWKFNSPRKDTKGQEIRNPMARSKQNKKARQINRKSAKK